MSKITITSNSTRTLFEIINFSVILFSMLFFFVIVAENMFNNYQPTMLNVFTLIGLAMFCILGKLQLMTFVTNGSTKE